MWTISFYWQVNFLRNCGSDNLCESDLDLNVQIVSPTNHLEVVHGHKAPLYIVCELVNRGEPAYLTEIHIQYQGEHNTICKLSLSSRHFPLYCPFVFGIFHPTIDFVRKGPIMQGFEYFILVYLNKLFKKQSNGW